VIGEHVLIALAVVTITHYLGEWIAALFGLIGSDTHVDRFRYDRGARG
jgi:hypothetical protein